MRYRKADSIALSLAAIVGLGVAARVWHYVGQRPLWGDEIWIAQSILERPFAGLLQPLANEQVAPIGWLFVTKLFSLAIGDVELSLRLFQLIAGVAGLILISIYIRKIVFYRNYEILIAGSLFSLLPILIYYSSEVKQYGTDAAITCVLLSLALYLFRKESLTPVHYVLLLATGGVAVIVSHSAPFILAGVGMALFYDAYRRKRYSQMMAVAGVSVLWAAIFGYLLFTFYLGDGNTAAMKEKWWGHTFPPFPPTSLADLKWGYGTYFSFFSFAFGQFHPFIEHRYQEIVGGVAGITFLLGMARFWRDDRPAAILLCVPLAGVVLAAIFHMYPLRGRLLLFLAPITILGVAAGVGVLTERAGTYRNAVAAALMVAFLVPIDGTLKSSLRAVPFGYFNFAPVFDVLKKQYRPGDTLYVYPTSLPELHFYLPCRNFSGLRVVQGRFAEDHWDIFLNDLASLTRYRRVWFALSHKDPSDGFDHIRMTKYLAKRWGRIVSERKIGSETVLLVEFPPSAAATARTMFPEPAGAFTPKHPGYQVREPRTFILEGKYRHPGMRSSAC